MQVLRIVDLIAYTLMEQNGGPGVILRVAQDKLGLSEGTLSFCHKRSFFSLLQPFNSFSLLEAVNRSTQLSDQHSFTILIFLV